MKSILVTDIPGYGPRGPSDYGYDKSTTLRDFESLQLKQHPYSNGLTQSGQDRITVCGIHTGAGGRNCSYHAVCGSHLSVGNVLVFKHVTVPVVCGLMQGRVAAVVLDWRGDETCTVGYASPGDYERDDVHELVRNGTRAQVISLGHHMTDPFMREQSRLYCGYANVYAQPALSKLGLRPSCPEVYSDDPEYEGIQL